MNKTAVQLLIISLGLCLSFIANAWQGAYNGNSHGHDQAYQSRSHNHANMPGYYNGWGAGPSVIINLPSRRYYQPMCERVEVCNPYGYCWLERECY